MKKIFILLLSSLSALYGSALEVTLTEGSLHDRMPMICGSTDNTLVLKGEATAYDLTALRNLPSTISSIDMSGLTIKAVTLSKEDWFGTKKFENNEIPAYMLLGTGVKSIVLPPGLKKIGDGAFSSTPLKTFKGGAISWLGKGIFHNCRQLESVDLSESKMSVIPERTFSGCVSLSEFSLPGALIYIGPHAFEGTGIKRADFPKVNEIGAYAFANASRLEEASYATGCRMGEGAFFGTGSLAHVIGEPGETGDLYAVNSGNRGRIMIRSRRIGEGAYAGSQAEEMRFIGEVAEVGARAFYSMPNLKEVNMSACTVVPAAHESSFDGTAVEKVVLYVKKGESGLWQNAPVWQHFIIIEDESSVDEISIPEADIAITNERGRIRIVAAEPITEVSVYSIDGMLLATSAPGCESVEIDFPDASDVAIVRAAAGESLKITKLMR